MNELSRHNNKAWFDENRKEYEAVKTDFQAFTKGLIEGCARFDPRICGIDVKDCTYRINRDIRFSKDKSPYKTHFGAYICPGGKKSGYSGYYFHIQADDSDYLGGCMLATGNYRYDPPMLESIRTEIYDHPEAFAAALKKAEGFRLEDDSKLSKVPKGFSPDFEYADFLKYRVYCMFAPLSKDFLLADDLAARVLQRFESTYDFNEILNKSIQYVMEDK